MTQLWYNISCYDRNSSFQSFANITFKISLVFMFCVSMGYFICFGKCLIYEVITDDKPEIWMSLQKHGALLFLSEINSISICNERSPFISLEDLTKLSFCRVLWASFFHPILISSYRLLNRLYSKRELRSIPVSYTLQGSFKTVYLHWTSWLKLGAHETITAFLWPCKSTLSIKESEKAVCISIIVSMSVLILRSKTQSFTFDVACVL